MLHVVRLHLGKGMPASKVCVVKAYLFSNVHLKVRRHKSAEIIQGDHRKDMPSRIK